jgi:hypothetical protein
MIVHDVKEARSNFAPKEAMVRRRHLATILERYILRISQTSYCGEEIELSNVSVFGSQCISHAVGKTAHEWLHVHICDLLLSGLSGMPHMETCKLDLPSINDQSMVD